MMEHIFGEMYLYLKFSQQKGPYSKQEYGPKYNAKYNPPKRPSNQKRISTAPKKIKQSKLRRFPVQFASNWEQSSVANPHMNQVASRPDSW